MWKSNNPIVHLILSFVPPSLLQVLAAASHQFPVNSEIEMPKQVCKHEFGGKISSVLPDAVHRANTKGAKSSFLRCKLLCSDTVTNYPPLGPEHIGLGEDVCVTVDYVVGNSNGGSSGDMLALDLGATSEHNPW